MTKAEIITSITTLAELDGYEREAKRRGITGDELAAIHAQRKILTPRKGKRK